MDKEVLIKLLEFSGFILIVGSIYFGKYKSFLKTLIFLLFLTVGMNVSIHFKTNESYVLGVISNYRILFVAALDIFICLVLIIGFLEKSIKLRYLLREKLLLLLLVGMVIGMIANLISRLGWISIFYYIRYIFYIFSVYMLVLLIRRKNLYLCVRDGLLLGSVLNVVVAWLQFFNTSAIGLYFLGESPIKRYISDIALVVVKNKYFLRGYGLFSHPNVLGCYFLFILIYLDYLKYWKSKNKLSIILLGLIVSGIFVTFSKTIWILTFVWIIFKISSLNIINDKKKLIFLRNLLVLVFSVFVIYLTIIFSSQSVDIRLQMLERGLVFFISNFRKYPLGVGITNYLNISAQNPIILNTGTVFNQPIHNIFLLLLIELGIIARFWYVYIFYRLFTQVKKGYISLAVFILVGCMVDHYFLTLNQSLFIFLFCLMSFGGKNFKKDVLFKMKNV